MRDLLSDMLGYLYNAAIRTMLEELPLEAGEAAIPENLKTCYQHLVAEKLVGEEELFLLDAWLASFEC